MAEEEKHIPTNSPNWLFGLDKLTTPSFNFLGLKLRDKLRVYLSEKARDRAIIRRYEKEFLYRQIDLLDYGADQYAACLDSMGNVISRRHFEVLLSLVRFAITNFNIPPEKAFECVIAGFTEEIGSLTGGELILFSAAASAKEMLLTLQAAKLMFHFANVPSSVHMQDSTVTDEQIDKMMQDESTMTAMNNATEFSDWGTAKWFAKTLTEVYGFEWDEENFRAREIAANQSDISKNDGDDKSKK